MGQKCITPTTRSKKKIKHHQDLSKLKAIFPYIIEYQALASKHYIRDIFQDNGGKYLQIALVTGFKLNDLREGNDGRDLNGKEIELKTVNSLLTKSFSTHHHLNEAIIKKYRKVDWYFAIYEGIILKKIYLVKRSVMECYYKAWEEKLMSRNHINNPKIPIRFVQSNGELVYDSMELHDAALETS